MPNTNRSVASIALLLGLLAGCGKGREELLPEDAAWCSAEATLVDPLPDVFDGRAGVDQVAADYVARDRYSSGIVIATVGGEGVRFYAAGDTRWDGGVAVDPDTVFELGSITKVFTGLLLADAIVRGEVELGDSCEAYLPSGVTVPSLEGANVTLRHLATHTSGLPREARGFSPGPYDDWYTTYTPQDFYQALGQAQLASKPGTRYSYSNMGACLLGHVLGLRAGLSYEELLRTRVLEPLGMTSTYLYQEPAGLQLATPYHHSHVETDYFMVPAGFEGAGRIRSSARDMARFARAALGLDPTPLDEAFRLSEALQFEGPGLDGTAADMGLGWSRGHAGGADFVAHGGGTWGFTASINLDLTRRHGTVVLTNSRHARDCLPGLMAYWLTSWQSAVTLDTATLSGYSGQYATPAGTIQITVEAGHLLALVPGRPWQRLDPEGGDRFFSLFQDLELKFDRDAAGLVSGLDLRTSADPAFAG